MARTWRRFAALTGGIALLVGASLTMASADSALTPAAIQPEMPARSLG